MDTQIELGDITVDVVLKEIKNIHLSVHPPTGRVRIAAPSRMDIDTIRVFAISKLDWIKEQQRKVVEAWYHGRIKQAAPPLIAK